MISICIKKYATAECVETQQNFPRKYATAECAEMQQSALQSVQDLYL
jgi:hypothetical protein